jgi:geranylgeranyl diphosphate synthase, type I
MDISDTLGLFKKEIDREIEAYFERVIKETKKRDRLVAESLEYVKKFILAGGKRLRPALMYYGYIGAGGKERKKMIKTAVSIELIHAFLLIHDDIIDRDDTRHGMDTVNVRYGKLGKKFFKTENSSHFGDSMAIIIGDMIGALGSQIIFESGFEDRLVMQALSKLQSIVSYTVIGQSKDIYMEYKKKATEKEIMEMYEYKTARYTIEGPLHLGVILGGGDIKAVENLTDYAIPIGIAFQIQDDILGIYGNEKKLGKPVGSDISEGKQTILLAKALELSTSSQKKMLENMIYKKNINEEELVSFRNIIKETGSLDYAKKLSTKLIFQGKKALEKINLNREAKKFLNGIADYMIEREI